ncbi:tetratricopeptide repeat protein [Candidatus Rhodobacter oscarellae]|nr:tetratricopeptide repeat protein [Candidatus Rhodobacter lobularis]
MSYYDLGDYSRALSNATPEAHTWFDRGLIWVFGFNHAEAIRCFERALSADPSCALAHWGIAFAVGPHYNQEWDFYAVEERQQMLDRAHAALALGKDAGGSEPEMALIEALAARYPTDPTLEDFRPFNDAFAAEMRRVHNLFPDDLDVTSVFVEAMMNRTPWALWDLASGQPAEGADTEEARRVIENAFDNLPGAWDHPGLLHLYIHLMEMSPWPEKALRHGDRLMTLCPDAGHLVHMATHIDVLCGDYQNVIARNKVAAQVDKAYEAQAGSENFYTVYRIHNIHFIAYGAMFLGQPTPALEACAALRDALPEATVRYLPELFEAFVAMDRHILVRFGKWEEILALELPSDTELYCFTTALTHYARGVALANLDRIAEAEAARDAFMAARDAVPEDRYMFNNPCAAVLEVAEAMLLGELAYKAARHAEGLEHLRDAVRLDDGLIYDEPWGWMQPARHALGGLLMDQQHYEEAESVYRADLGLDATLARPCQHPGNVWALHGLHECLAKRNEDQEINHVRAQLDLAMARSDIEIKASCYCRANA